MNERIKRAAHMVARVALVGLIAACGQRESHIIEDKNVGFFEAASCSRTRDNPVSMSAEDAVRYASLLPGRMVEVSGKPRLVEKYIRENDTGFVSPGGSPIIITGYALRRVYDVGEQSPFYVVLDLGARAKSDLETDFSAGDPELGFTAFRGCAATDNKGKVYLRAQG